LSSGFNQQAILNLKLALKSQASDSGLFRRVLGHEPKSAPGNGVSFALWLGPITPIPTLSGLNATAGKVIWTARIYVPWIQSDEDQTEVQMMHCVLEMLANYSATFTIGGTVMEVDLLGSYGTALEASTVGYTEIDGTHYRAAELTIPVIIDNLWTQHG